MSNNPTTITTGQARLSYVHLYQPYSAQPNQEPKYSVTILIPKTDIATKQRIDAAINAAITAAVAGKWNGARPPQISTPVQDGDGLRRNGEPFGQECKGHWVINASSKQQPPVCDLQLNPIINQTEVYSGMYARVSINFFGFFNSGNKGIGCGLNAVQKVADGEPLGNRVSVESAFGDTGFAAPQQFTQPVQQPVYTPPQPGGYIPPSNGAYYPPAGAPVQQQAIDPITGLPINGGIYGL
ncbi:MAG TPA: DUF2815 family protein [Pseudobacteroides sp.]|uniref:DUF2815 family protein n=1 Tax=Pseudobacteroides sp. TaxID=1968840 RepID=UPI002F944D54